MKTKRRQSIYLNGFRVTARSRPPPARVAAHRVLPLATAPPRLRPPARRSVDRSPYPAAAPTVPAPGAGPWRPETRATRRTTAPGPRAAPARREVARGASGLRRSAAGAGGPSGDVSVGTWRAARDASPVGIATTALVEPLVGADSGASGGGLPQAESPANSRRPRHRARREHITRRRSRDGRMAADLSGDGVEMGSGLVLSEQTATVGDPRRTDPADEAVMGARLERSRCG